MGNAPSTEQGQPHSYGKQKEENQHTGKTSETGGGLAAAREAWLAKAMALEEMQNTKKEARQEHHESVDVRKPRDLNDSQCETMMHLQSLETRATDEGPLLLESRGVSSSDVTQSIKQSPDAQRSQKSTAMLDECDTITLTSDIVGQNMTGASAEYCSVSLQTMTAIGTPATRDTVVTNSMTAIGRVILLQLARQNQEAGEPLSLFASIARHHVQQYRKMERHLPQGSITRLDATEDDVLPLHCRDSSSQNEIHTVVIVPSCSDEEKHTDSTSFERLVKSCAERGVTFIVLLSSTLAKTGQGEMGLKTREQEQVVRDSGIAYCLLRLPWPTEFYLSLWMRFITRNRFLPGVIDRTSYLPVVALKDVGRTVSQVVFGWKNHIYQTYTLISEVTPIVEILRTLSANLGYEIRYRHWQESVIQSELEAMTCPATVARCMAQASLQWHDGLNAATYQQLQTIPRITGDIPTTLGDVLCSPILMDIVHSNDSNDMTIV